MNAALSDLKALGYSKAKVSLYEAFLTAKWLEAHGRHSDPTVSDANDAVAAIFQLLPDHELGRVYPFRFDWLTAAESGRKTVWNNTTRGPKLATTIFNRHDIRGGLIPSAAQTIATTFADDRLPSREALSALVLHDYSFGPNDDWTVAEQQLQKQLSMSAADLAAVTDSRPLGVPLLGDPEWSPDTLDESVAAPTHVTVSATPGPTGQVSGAETVVVDSRVERMLLRCVRMYTCVLLVGPPGTGKGTLVRWLVDQVKADPTAFGFAATLDPDPMWRTPDESWSAFELVGGLAPDKDALLTWANGLLLDSLASNRWLVLDETNRTDLDKIMGPLLTWLSSQEVEVGRSRAHGGEAIRIGWGEANECEADTPDSDTKQPTRFVAGTDWRLLGTYNPQDAQRVFRMGQALSRRFVVVPVPALPPGQFEKLLETSLPSVTEDARAAITGLYSAHHSSAETLLGPAVFLRMGRYLEQVEASDVPEFLAESYVVNVGKFTSAFDDTTFDRLGTRIVEDELALTREQWSWISTQRHTLG